MNKPRIRKLFRRLSIGFSVVLFAVFLFFLLRPEGEYTVPENQYRDKEPVFSLRILSWNVETSTKGIPWEKRQQSFREVLKEQDFYIICLQEAEKGQIEFFSKLYPGHEVYGVGRDDGKSKGEHGPIFFKTGRFRLVKKETFWLSKTPEKPSTGWGELYPRVCSTVELLDIPSGKTFRVFNTHLHLHPYAQIKGAELISSKIDANRSPTVLVGDMNCPPSWKPIKKFNDLGLTSAESSGALTFHMFGKPLRCLDPVASHRTDTSRTDS